MLDFSVYQKDILIKFHKNKNVFYEGNEIKGIITLLINQTKLNDKLTLNLSMEEYWYKNEKEKNSINDILKTETIIITKIDGTPFSFILPKNLNPSFEYPGKIFNAFIKYYLIVEYENNGKKYTEKEIILIKSELNDIPFTDNIFGCDVKNYLGLINHGHCSAKIILHKKNVVIGEKLKFSLDINNESCDLDIENIKINFNRNVNVYDNNNRKLTDLYHFIKEFYPHFIKKGEKDKLDFEIEIKDKDFKSFHKDLWNSAYNQINDLNDLLPSVSSTIIECIYILKITIYFSSSVPYNSRPRKAIELNVCHKDNSSDSKILKIIDDKDDIGFNKIEENESIILENNIKTSSIICSNLILKESDG